MTRIGRALLFALLLWWTLGMVTGNDPWCFLDYVNLAFHEAGHVFMKPLGTTLYFLGGTLGQIFVPALLVGYFLLRRFNPFGAAFCTWWLGQNFVNVSVYMADARDLALPLVGGGIHDWNELLYRFDMLDEPSVKLISSVTFGCGVVVMLVGLLWVAFFLMPGWIKETVLYDLEEKAPFIGALSGER